jgi:hypothetical protein
MKYLLMLLLLVSTPAFSDSGFFSDPTRDGEGLILIDDGKKKVFAFFTYIDASLAIPPVPIPGLPELVPCNNCQTWYIGNEGFLYKSAPIEYPLAVDGSIDVKFSVGTYKLIPYLDGYIMDVKCNDTLPPDMFLCNHLFEFTFKVF